MRVFQFVVFNLHLLLDLTQIKISQKPQKLRLRLNSLVFKGIKMMFFNNAFGVVDHKGAEGGDQLE